MAKQGRQQREEIAEKRLRSVLGRYGVATLRTLEQKISDAGPTNQRIDPHILNDVRRRLVDAGVIKVRVEGTTPWFYLADTTPKFVRERLAELLAVYRNIAPVNMRIGQTLEIAVFRSLRSAAEAGVGDFVGGFADLDDHDDKTLYRKIEPEMFSGKRAPRGKLLDFIFVQNNLAAGIEVKNIREWIYPQREEVRDLLAKALALNVVPVLIARRIHFSAFSVLNLCGVVLHQNYNQLYPDSEALLAADARHKDMLGYHDIRIGNMPDARLTKFIGSNLPKVLPAARAQFDDHKDLIEDYTAGRTSYEEFVGRTKRRSRGEAEDGVPPWKQ